MSIRDFQTQKVVYLDTYWCLLPCSAIFVQQFFFIIIIPNCLYLVKFSETCVLWLKMYL